MKKGVRRKQYLWFTHKGIIKRFNKLNIQYHCEKYLINKRRDKICFIYNGKYFFYELFMVIFADSNPKLISRCLQN